MKNLRGALSKYKNDNLKKEEDNAWAMAVQEKYENSWCEYNTKISFNDTEELAEKAADIIENNKVLVPNEVIGEIVYVLEKVYKVKNDELSEILICLFQYENIKVDDLEVIKTALELYGRRRFDFVDTLLYAYNHIRNYQVCTFDKKLDKLLK